MAKHIKLSARGKMGITTVSQEFLKDRELKMKVLGSGLAKPDTSMQDSLAEASVFVEVVDFFRNKRLK